MYIAESDPITVSISGPSTVSEGDTTTVYTVSLSPSGVTPTADLTVDYSTVGRHRRVGDGLRRGLRAPSPSPAQLLVRRPSRCRPPRTPLGESDETFTVSLDTPTGGGGPAPSRHATEHSVTTTITDDDALTGITLSVDPDTVEEDGAATAVNVTATFEWWYYRVPSATVVTIGTLSRERRPRARTTAVTSLASITIPANRSSGTGSYHHNADGRLDSGGG